MSALLTRILRETDGQVSSAILLREVNRISRRWQTYAARVAFAAALLTGLLTLVWIAVSGLVPTENLGWLGRGLFIGFTVGQLFLAALFSPLFTAQAISEEIADHTLETLLLTRLRPVQIFGGKLVSCILLLTLFALGAAPVMSLIVGLGGVSTYEVIAVSAHTILTIVLSCALGGFFALYTRSAILASFGSMAYVALAYTLPAAGYTMMAGQPSAATHLSPFAGPAAAGWSALLPVLAFVPSIHLILSLATPLFELKLRGARQQHSFASELWRPLHRLMEAGVLLVVGAILVPVAAIVIWGLRATPQTPWFETLFSVAAQGTLWVWWVGALHLFTWIFLRLTIEIVASVETLSSDERRVVVGLPVRVWSNPVAWREARPRRWTTHAFPLLVVWGGSSLAMLQGLWSWMVPGALLLTGLSALGGAMILATWLATQSVEADARDNTLELLLCTSMSSARIVSGKLAGVAAATLPLLLLAAPFLILGYPHAILLDPKGSGPWDYVSAAGFGVGTWVWALTACALVSVGGMVLAVRQRNRLTAFGTSCGLLFGLGSVALFAGRLFPDNPWTAVPARLLAPPLAGDASAWQLILSTLGLGALALVLFVALSRRIRGWTHAALGLLLLTPTLSHGQSTPLQDGYALEATPLADGLVRPDTWTAVHLPIENRGGAGVGRLRLIDRLGNSMQSWTRPIELPEGSQKEVLLLYRTTSHTRDRAVELDSPGRHAEASFSLRPMEARDVSIGVVGQDPSGLPSLIDTWHDTVPGPGPRQELSDEIPRPVHVGVMPEPTLPTHSAAYASLDWIVWPDADPSRLSTRQVDALRNWVASGGHLFLTFTDTWRQVADSSLASTLPVSLHGLTDASMLPLYDVLAATGTQEVLPTPIARPVTREGRAIWQFAETETGDPLWVSGTYGLGTVHLFLTDVDALGVPRPLLWRTLLWLPEPAASAPRVPLPPDLAQALDTQLAPNPAACAAISQWDPAWPVIRADLSDIPGVAPLPMSWLLLFSALYLLAIGPLDYLILKRLGRQPLTWITFPLTVALFSAIALIGTTWTKGTEATVTRVELIDVLPGTDLWRGSSHVGVFATEKTDLTVTSGFRDGVVMPKPEAGFMTDSRVISSDGPGRLTYRAETWTLGLLETQWVAPAPGEVRLTLDEARATVSSALPVDLEDVWLGHEGRWTRLLAGLPAGASETIPLGALTKDAPKHEVLPRLDLVERLDRGGHIHGSDETWMLLATLNEPIEPILLDGLAPTHRTKTLIRVPLTPSTAEAP